jgi:hypothetical protein
MCIDMCKPKNEYIYIYTHLCFSLLRFVFSFVLFFSFLFLSKAEMCKQDSKKKKKKKKKIKERSGEKFEALISYGRIQTLLILHS